MVRFLSCIASGGVTKAIREDTLSVISCQQITPVGIAIGIAVAIGCSGVADGIVGVVVGSGAIGGFSQLSLVVGRQGDRKTVPLFHYCSKLLLLKSFEKVFE